LDILSPLDLIYSDRNGENIFEWYPTSNDPRFSLIPLLLGTFLTAIPATIISSFFGIGIGIFISEFAPRRIRNYLKQLIDLFASLPTVAVGFILLTVGVTFFDSVFDADNRLNAVLAAFGLSLIIIPQIASLTEEALRGIPDDIRMAAFSLGAGRWRTVKDIVFPAAISGISASVVLGFGRAVGDTMISFDDLW
jgi:phosphate transport system permease protein